MDSDDELPDDFVKALIDRYESWELAEMLGVSCREFVEQFEDYIRDNFEELCEEIGYGEGREEDE